MSRHTTDEEIAAAVKTWNTSSLVMAASMHAELMVHEYNGAWHQMLGLKWPGIERLGKDDIYPMFRAAEAELDARLPKPA